MIDLHLRRQMARWTGKGAVVTAFWSTLTCLGQHRMRTYMRPPRFWGRREGGLQDRRKRGGERCDLLCRRVSARWPAPRRSAVQSMNRDSVLEVRRGYGGRGSPSDACGARRATVSPSAPRDCSALPSHSCAKLFTRARNGACLCFSRLSRVAVGSPISEGLTDGVPKKPCRTPLLPRISRRMMGSRSPYVETARKPV